MIAEHVIAQGSVRVESLARIVGVSAMTIYRDVANLEQAGIVHLDRGMVRAVATSLSEADAEFRLQQSPRIKQAMAKPRPPRTPRGAPGSRAVRPPARWFLPPFRAVNPLPVSPPGPLSPLAPPAVKARSVTVGALSPAN